MNDEPKWEYNTISVLAPYNQYSTVELNASGEEGWELVQINAGGVALMRRRANAERPKPVWVTTQEGGEYIPWEEWQAEFRKRPHTLSFDEYMNKFRIHSVGFDNGWVFDNMVGWRKQ
jgi:hypothetical protein